LDSRAVEIDKLKGELNERRKRVKRRMRELDAHAVGAFPPPQTSLAAEHEPEPEPQP